MMALTKSMLTVPAVDTAEPPLKPAALLQRLRPLKLTALKRRLIHRQRLALACRRLGDSFPWALAHYPDTQALDWWSVLAQLVNYVEAADLWPVDWALLNDAWRYWLEDETESGDHLATFLDYIPVQFQGLSDEVIYDYPPLELLRALLSVEPVEAVSTDLLIPAGCVPKFG